MILKLDAHDRFEATAPPERKLRIGILTFHFSENFGALLQAFGLRSWLAGHGHQVEFINYQPSHVEQGGAFRRLWDPRAAKSNAKIAFLKFSHLHQRVFCHKQQAESLAAFRRDALGLSGPPLRTPREIEAHLAAMNPCYDLIVVGSDQIWSASAQYGLDEAYFCDFAVPEGTRRIAYAPSFGRSTVEPEHRSAIARMLAKLDRLSCRESSGAEIIRDLIGRDVACVPDPTLLLGDFSAMIRDAGGPDNYVFCYALRSADGIREVAHGASKKLGATLLSPYNPHRRWREIGKTVYPSPGQWVDLVRGAAFVVTNSFHGTAFSILLRKPFLVVGLRGKRAALNERALNLLRELDLLDRFVENGDLRAAQHLLEQPIDWEGVADRLAQLQMRGRNYLLREIADCRTA